MINIMKGNIIIAKDVKLVDTNSKGSIFLKEYLEYFKLIFIPFKANNSPNIYENYEYELYNIDRGLSAFKSVYNLF